MTKIICSKITLEGFHQWIDAPQEYRYLSQPHRHLFVVRAYLEVGHDNRETEFIHLGQVIRDWFQVQYGTPCQFGGMSCEMIAEKVLNRFSLYACSVFEDDENGAIIYATRISTD